MTYPKRSTARDSHTLFGVSCWFSFHSFKAVVSTGQFRDKKHGSWQFVSQLQFVLWEYLTLFPEMSAFWFSIPKAGMEPVGSSWHRMVCRWHFPSGPSSYPGAELHFFLFRLLLKSHQVCRNLLFVTLAGCTQMLKPQHCIHSTASLKLV